jgi:hypothetical protein
LELKMAKIAASILRLSCLPTAVTLIVKWILRYTFLASISL